MKDYADCPRLMREGQPTLGEEAKQELFELRYLRIGKAAPDIAAEGVDGQKLKLSDYRGKVTVVNFWASWCGPCMAMLPHERELVERLKDKPFILIGVNGDETREKAKEVMAKEKMTWPSFWNGDKDDEKAHQPRLECPRLADDLRPRRQGCDPFQGRPRQGTRQGRR